MRVWLVFILSIGLASPIHAETYSFPEYGFEMTCADSWEQISLVTSEDFDTIDTGNSDTNELIRSRPLHGLLRLWNPGEPTGGPPEILVNLRPMIKGSAYENLKKGRQKLLELLEVLSIRGPSRTWIGEFEGAVLDASVTLYLDGEPLVARVLQYRAKLGSNELAVIVSHAPDIDPRVLPEIDACVQSLRRIGQPSTEKGK